MKTVFFDVDTQLDFLYPAGALYVPGAEKLVPTLAKLTRFAAEHQLPIIATMDAHSENDPEFETWKPHCVVGTTGQEKVSATRAPGQTIIEKQTIDCFSNTNLSALLDRLQADRFVVYGVATEVCVRCAAFGLLKTRARVDLVIDAIKGINTADEQRMLDGFRAQGGSAIKSSDVLA